MGNMLPACLVHHQGTTAALPSSMKPRLRRLVSLKLLVKVVHKLKKMTRGSRKGELQAKIGSNRMSSADDGGRELGEEVTRKVSSSNPNDNVQLRSSSRVLRGGGGHKEKKKKKKGVVRMKVVLTKEEAARLLTLTAGGRKTAAQIVAEIKRMELRRGVANNNNAAWRPALESIPEETSIVACRRGIK